MRSQLDKTNYSKKNKKDILSLDLLKEKWQFAHSVYQQSLEEFGEINQFIYFLHKEDNRSQTEIANQLGLSVARVSTIISKIEKTKEVQHCEKK